MSTVRVSSIQNLNGVEVYTAKAWVSFNGVGTVGIRGSGNVSSITDNGVADYTINFNYAFSDANYAVSLSSQPDRSSYGIGAPIIHPSFNPTTSGVRVVNYFQDDNNNAVYYGTDSPYYHVIVFR